MILYSVEAPVAYSMVSFARQSLSRQTSVGQPLETNNRVYQLYLCYWAAFNNIYVTIYDKKGSPRARYLQEKESKKVQEVRVANLRMLKVWIPSEKDQLSTVCTVFDRELRYKLVNHESAGYFARRIPKWKDKEVETDKFGQRLNGVLNVGRTLSRGYPVWSPIDIGAYEQYMGRQNEEDGVPDDLIEQIVNILYTVRNNLFHGGKRVHDENDIEVVEKALPLLSMIVESFLIPYREEIHA